MIRKVLAAIISGVMLFSLYGCTGEDTPAPTGNTAVSTKDTSQSKQYVEAYGKVKAGKTQSMYLDFPITIEDVYIKNGQRVKKGDKLLKIDTSKYDGSIQDKEQELKIAELTLQKSGLITDTASELKKLKNDISNAKSVYESDKDKLAKQELLFKAKAVSLADVEEYKATLGASKKALDDAEFALEAYNNKIRDLSGSLKYDIAIQNEKVSKLKAELSLMKANIDKSFLKDGFVISELDNGSIVNFDKSKGEYVEEDKQLCSMVDLDSMTVQAEVPEEFYKDIRAGANVQIIPTADKSKKYSGKVTYISNELVQKTTESVVTVEISIDKLDGFLFPDLNVELQIEKE